MDNSKKYMAIYYSASGGPCYLFTLEVDSLNQDDIYAEIMRLEYPQPDSEIVVFENTNFVVQFLD